MKLLKKPSRVIHRDPTLGEPKHAQSYIVKIALECLKLPIITPEQPISCH